MTSKARVVVAVDFGTTFSGFAYAKTSEPNAIFKVQEWPNAGRAGVKPYCKTQTSLYYAPSGNQDGHFELKDWGWSGLLKHIEALKHARAHTGRPKYHLRSGGGAPLLLHGAKNAKNTGPRSGGAPLLLHGAKNAKNTCVDALALPMEATQEVGFFAMKFKLHLAPDANPLSQNLPGDITAERMVIDYLRKLSDFIINELQLVYGKHFGKEDVQWCLTVPAIWDERAKQIMKVCAEKAGMVKGAKCPEGVAASPYPIDIILEPEAASIYCQHKAKTLNLRQGAKLLVADVGGGTIDLVVHEKADEDPQSLRVHEVVSSYGDVGGGTFVDANFIKFLGERIGCFKEVCQNNPNVLLKMHEWWQGIKVGFDGEGYSAETELPRTLSEAWERYDKELGNECEDEDHYKELKLEDSDITSIFHPEVEKVLSLIEKQIKGVNVLMLVGGFAASPYLRKCIKRKFESRVEEVIIPDEPGSAICHGAVQLHMGKDVIQSRVAKRTYGISSTRDAELDDPAEMVYIDDDGERQCRNFFSVFVRVGERVPLNESIKKKFVPVVHAQREITFSLCSTTNKSPKFITEPNVVKEGTFQVDISEGLSLDKAREVEVNMVFGASLVQVSATRLNFGKPGSERGLSVTFHEA